MDVNPKVAVITVLIAILGSLGVAVINNIGESPSKVEYDRPSITKIGPDSQDGFGYYLDIEAVPNLGNVD